MHDLLAFCTELLGKLTHGCRLAGAVDANEQHDGWLTVSDDGTGSPLDRNRSVRFFSQSLEDLLLVGEFATAHAVLDVIEDEKLCDRAEQLGSRLKQRLQGIRDDVPEIVDIRGPGFMNAVEFNIAGTSTPNPDFANNVKAKALEKGLILLTCGVYGNVIRFLAPVTIEDETFSEALDILESSIRETAGKAA